MAATAQTLPLDENPFRKQEGDCERCGAKGVRIFWCHVCTKLFCWECFKVHAEG
jgi:late competence protein required for DNA uptake (superfamily II DNA/RNA helicase)